MFAPHDGQRVTVHPYRRMMGFLMRGRNESAVYFEQRLDLSRTLPWLESHRARLFPLVLHALASTLHERERLNRFTVGRRTYQRNGVYLSFAPFDLDGRFVCPDLRERVIALDARRLGRLPVAIGVASGETKVRPILGALRAGIVRTLVTDVATAEAVVALDEATLTPSDGGPR